MGSREGVVAFSFVRRGFSLAACGAWMLLPIPHVRIALLSTCALATPPKRYGGTELVVAELARGLIEGGHRVTVYGTGDSGAAGDLRHCFATPVWPPDEMAERRHARFAW